MSNRSILEFNHDYSPSDEAAAAWASEIRRYLRSGDPAILPDGVTYFGMRHHSDPCPLGDPPRGWHNDKPQSHEIRSTIPALVGLLKEACEIVRAERDGLLYSACHISQKTGKPLRGTLTESDLDAIKPLDDWLKRARTALR